MVLGMKINIKTIFVCVIVVIISSSSSFAEDKMTYWVSKNFSEAPGDVTFDKFHMTIPTANPLIHNLDQLTENGADADIRLCFDNRGIRYSHVDELQKGSKDYRQYCEIANEANGIGYFVFDNQELYKQITHGVRLSRLGEKITCEAIFTMQSLFSFLSYHDAPLEQRLAGDIRIEPYSGDFLSETFNKGFLQYLDLDDKVAIKTNYNLRTYFPVLEIDKTWNCVSPAFRLYWQKVIAACKDGVRVMRKDKTQQHVSYDILKTIQNDLYALTKQCRVGDINRSLDQY